MLINSGIIAAKRLRCSLACAFAFCLFALGLPAFAHGGFEHVIGNVEKVVNNVMTVKTSTGNVDVKLDAKTEITKTGQTKQKAQITDLTPGTRVVVDVPEADAHDGAHDGAHDNGPKLAHSVKIGAAPPADHAAH